MRISNVMAKSKMNGYEVGRLIIQSFLYELKQIFADDTQNIKELLTALEIKHMQDQLKDIYDIEIYMSCRMLWEYLIEVWHLTTLVKKEIQVIVFQLYSIVTYEIQSEELKFMVPLPNQNGRSKNYIKELEEKMMETIMVDYENIEIPELVVEKIYEFSDLMKQWYVFEATVEIISERMGLPDLKILVSGSPLKYIENMKSLIFSLESLYPTNRISKALFINGISSRIPREKITEDTPIFDVEKLKPSKENIEYARRVAQDLTYFIDGNHLFHTVVEGKEAKRGGSITK